MQSNSATPPDLEAARAAKPAVLSTFGALATVAGIGITRIGGRYGLKVNLQSAPPAHVRLPSEVDGVPIRVEVVGPIHKR